MRASILHRRESRGPTYRANTILGPRLERVVLSESHLFRFPRESDRAKCADLIELFKLIHQPGA